VEEAVRRGDEVVVLDNLSTGKLGNLAASGDGFTFIQGDIQDPEAVARAVRGAEVVFHHAAMAAVPLSVADPMKCARINDLGTLGVFLAARDAGVRRVVYASSSAVYGRISELPHREDMIPDPTSPYAAHKLIGEHYAAMFGLLYGLEVVSFRYFNVYGPRQDPSSPYSGVISIFMDRIRRGDPPVVFGDGLQSRDFIHVKDVVAANFLAASAPGAAGRVYNVGTGRSITLLDMIAILEKVSGRKAAPVFGPPQPGDVHHSRAQVARIAEELGFQSAVELEAGLRETYQWFVTQGA
jgi:UDP-glucose 4-epimerase